MTAPRKERGFVAEIRSMLIGAFIALLLIFPTQYLTDFVQKKMEPEPFAIHVETHTDRYSLPTKQHFYFPGKADPSQLTKPTFSMITPITAIMDDWARENGKIDHGATYFNVSISAREFAVTIVGFSVTRMQDTPRPPLGMLMPDPGFTSGSMQPQLNLMVTLPIGATLLLDPEAELEREQKMSAADPMDPVARKEGAEWSLKQHRQRFEIDSNSSVGINVNAISGVSSKWKLHVTLLADGKLYDREITDEGGRPFVTLGEDIESTGKWGWNEDEDRFVSWDDDPPGS